jgi:steroid 5-alpha reductase family enzyme
MLKNSTTPSVTQGNWKTNRTTGFIFISFSYIIALIIGLVVFNSVNQTVLINLLLADLAATFVIWVCSLMLDNASVYDPYWSIQPMVILPLIVLKEGTLNLSTFLLCAVVILWGLRLTANWALTFRGLHEQDWRYDLIKSKTGKIYPIVNLLGIQLMPTLVIFACIAPIIFVIRQAPDFTLMLLPGVLVSLFGLAMEAKADSQLRDFRRNNPGRNTIIHQGLWKYSRHPNYLGEILMWWGAYLACLAVYPSAWQLGLGAFLNTALFIFVSIPMAENRLTEYKDGFLEYQQQTRMLLPLPKKTER